MLVASKVANASRYAVRLESRTYVVQLRSLGWLGEMACAKSAWPENGGASTMPPLQKVAVNERI
jgi:hypothetical protein